MAEIIIYHIVIWAVFLPILLLSAAGLIFAIWCMIDILIKEFKKGTNKSNNYRC